MTVFRLAPIPHAPARGVLVVAGSVIPATARALRGFRGRDGRHEGLVLWTGRVIEPITYVLGSIVPRSEHGRGFVRVSERSMGAAARRARSAGLGIVAQVHSHPDSCTHHSDGDDRLVFMPFEGMFSLVVGRYGDGGMLPAEGAGLHQYQDRAWVRVEPGADEAIRVVDAITEV